MTKNKTGNKQEFPGTVGKTVPYFFEEDKKREKISLL